VLYRIADLSVDSRSGNTRVLVEFWASRKDFDTGAPCVVKNDFYNNYRGDDEYPIEDTLGRRMYGGVYSVPWFEENGDWVRRTNCDTLPMPVPQMIHQDILRWWNSVGQAKRVSVLDTAAVKAAPTVDPLKVMARDDVKALAGMTWTDGV
jgi:hypothetical protein